MSPFCQRPFERAFLAASLVIWVGFAQSAVYFYICNLVPLQLTHWNFAVLACSSLLLIWKSKSIFPHWRTFRLKRPLDTDQASSSRRFGASRWTKTFLQLMPGVFLIGFNWKIYADSSRGFRTVPNHDAIHHATQVSNILRWKTATPEVLYAMPSGLADQRHLNPGGLYPLAAQLSQITGRTASEAMFLIAEFTSVIVLPLSLLALIFLFSRNTVQPFHLAMVMLLISGIYILPFSPLSWGGTPTLVGVSLIAITLLLMERVEVALSNRLLNDAVAKMASLIVLLPLFAIHTSEAFFCLALNGLYGIFSQSRTAPPRHSFKVTSLNLLAVVLGFFWTLIEARLGIRFLHQLGELTPYEPNIPQAIGQILLFAPHSSEWTLLPPLLWLLAMSAPPGHLKRGVKVVTLWTLFVFTSGALLTGRGPLSEFSSVADVWYRQYARISYLWVLPLAALAVICLDSLWNTTKTAFTKYFYSVRQGFGAKELLVVLSMSATAMAACSIGYLVYREGVRSKIRFATTTFTVIGSMSDADREMADADFFYDNSGSFLAEFNTGTGLWWADYSVESSAASYYGRDTQLSIDLLVGLAQNADGVEIVKHFCDSKFKYLVVNERSLGERIGPHPGQIDQSASWVKVIQGDTVSVWALDQMTACVG